MSLPQKTKQPMLVLSSIWMENQDLLALLPTSGVTKNNKRQDFGGKKIWELRTEAS
jgi:hypothetical protein